MRLFSFFFVSLFYFGGISLGFAQKFGYIDDEFVLSKMPAYQKVQQNLDESRKRWEEEVQKRFASVEKLRKDFQAQEILLTEEMKDERSKEIEKLDLEARTEQTKIFGFEGQFFMRQKELLKPVQEELHKALNKLARDEKLQIILSNSQGVTILYMEPRHDYTEQLLKQMGLAEEKTAPNEKGKDATNVPVPEKKK